MPSPPLLSVLIVNLNGGDMLRACVDSLLRQTRPPAEVIVVDNGSTDLSWDLSVFRENSHFKLIRLDRNAGFSEANNIAFAASTGEYIVLLNNDVELEEHCLQEMAEAAQPAHIGSVACQLRQKHNPHLIDSVGFELYFNGSTQTAYGSRVDTLDPASIQPFGPVASAALYKRQAVEQTGFLFHPEYFAYYEDTDLAIRLRLYGYEVAYAPKALAWHIGSATGKRKSEFHTFHLRRNIEFVFWVNMSSRHLVQFFFSHVFCEFVACCNLITRKQGLVFFRAKISFLKKGGWVLRERRMLQKRLNPARSRAVEKELLGMVPYMRKKIKAK